MYAEVFPARLKKAREFSGLTQVEAARALRIARPTYTNYEAGRSEPNMEMLALISKLFEVDANWLIGLTTQSPISSLQQIREEREREKIFKKLEKEAELDRRVWG